MKTKNSIKNTTLLIATLLFANYVANGQRDYYIPKAIPTPMHNQAKQLSVSVGYGMGADINCSYSFNNKYSVFAGTNLNFANYRRTTILGGEYKIYKNDLVANVGGGYYWNSNKILFEAIMGFGINKVNNHWYFTEYTESVEYTKSIYWNTYINLNLGLKAKGIIYGLATRASYSIYSKFEFYDTHPNENILNTEYQGLKMFSVEPALFFDLEAINNFSVSGQLGIALPFSGGKFTKIETFKNDSQTESQLKTTNVIEGAFFWRLCIRYHLNLQ